DHEAATAQAAPPAGGHRQRPPQGVQGHPQGRSGDAPARGPHPPAAHRPRLHHLSTTNRRLPHVLGRAEASPLGSAAGAGAHRPWRNARARPQANRHRQPYHLRPGRRDVHLWVPLLLQLHDDQDQIQPQLTQSLYFQNLDCNGGVLYRLLDEAEEQECREAVLAYFFLWHHAGPEGWTLADLDARVEEYLRQRAGVEADFEVNDAVAKLERLDLVERGGDRYRARRLECALRVPGGEGRAAAARAACRVTSRCAAR